MVERAGVEPAQPLAIFQLTVCAACPYGALFRPGDMRQEK